MSPSLKTIPLLLAAAVLAGCATPPPATAIKEPLSARPKPFEPIVNNGGIFQPDSRPKPSLALFEDRKARHVGDTLTVNLVEKTEAKRKSETTDERKANASVDVPVPIVMGHELSKLGPTTWNPSASNKQEFKDNETNTNEFKGAITVTVVDVLANGNLVVAGEKQVAINNDTEYIRLSGVVNPAHIRSDNTVDSTRLANVTIESKNAQSLDVAQVGSLIARFFLTVLPF